MICFSRDEELFRKIAKLFIENSQKQLEKTQQAIASGDCMALERIVHSLKDLLTHFGAKNAFKVALELEIIGREGDIILAGEVYTVLEKEIGRLKRELTSEISTTSGYPDYKKGAG